MKVKTISIQQVAYIKFLGLQTESGLRWYDHTNELCEKLARVCMLYSLQTQFGAEENVALLLPVYAYVCINTQNTKPVFKLQKLAVSV